jgi:2-methylcitrate dehydratase PrpD
MNSPLTDTQRFAGFIETFAYERIPPAVIARTKEVIYDGIGALLSATSTKYDIGAILSRFIRESGGAPESQVFGTPLRTNCVTAALVNGNIPAKVECRDGVRRLKAVFSFRSRLSLPGG